MKSLFRLAALCFLALSHTHAQDIYFYNPSFEDIPQHSKTPRGWTNCGFPLESPPDIHPSNTFGVFAPAFDGDTYLGLVVRDNDTWESISQQLSRPLEPGKCYELSFFAARSSRYISTNRRTGLAADYREPVILRFYGAFNYCDREELLGKTEPVIDAAWTYFQVSFAPSQAYDFIVIEAFYQPDVRQNYNGNVLLDRLYPLQLCDAQPPDNRTAGGPNTAGAPEAAGEQPRQNGIPMSVGQPAAPPEILAFAQADALNDLKDIVVRYGPEVNFSSYTDELNRSAYYRKNLPGIEYFQNEQLHRIVEALRPFPRVRLTIGVNGASALSAERRKEELEWALQELRLPDNQYRIIDFNAPKADRENWLWHEEGLAVYMNLTLR